MRNLNNFTCLVDDNVSIFVFLSCLEDVMLECRLVCLSECE